MSAKKECFRPLLARRSIIAATAGLAAAAACRNYATAQLSGDDLPEAGPELTEVMPQAAPALRFTNAAGRALTLADYAGHGLVVNLWATWCGPCVAEIPSLAAVAPVLAKSRILVLPISLDMEGAGAVRPFYASHHIAGLPVLLNPDGTATDVLNAPGIPVTIIINAAGQLVARLVGAANWNSAGTLATIRRLAAVPSMPGVAPAVGRGGGVYPVSVE